MRETIRTISCKLDEGKNLKHYVDFFEKENIDISEVFFLWDECEYDSYSYFGGSFNHEILEDETEYKERIIREEKEKLQKQIDSLERSIKLTEQKKISLCEELKKLTGEK